MAQASDNLFDTTGIRIKKDACVVIIKTEWNEVILNELQAGAIRVLEQFGIRYKVFTVPGAVEIPFAINAYHRNHPKGRHSADAFIALGCIIKGDTPHFEYVSYVVSDGVSKLNSSLPVPVIFGVLTVLNEQQALDRIGGRHGHKGEEAAVAAIKMMSLNEGFKKKGKKQ